MDIEQADRELRESEYAGFRENAELKAIISGQQAKKMSITVNGIEVFIKASIPKGVRDRIVSVARDYKDGDTIKADDEIYRVISTLCLDPPYTVPNAWRFIDEETGAVPDILKQILEKITGVETSAKRFRGER